MNYRIKFLAPILVGLLAYGCANADNSIVVALKIQASGITFMGANCQGSAATCYSQSQDQSSLLATVQAATPSAQGTLSAAMTASPGLGSNCFGTVSFPLSTDAQSNVTTQTGTQLVTFYPANPHSGHDSCTTTTGTAVVTGGPKKYSVVISPNLNTKR